MVTNTGTYMDCPFHRFEQGKDFSKISLERFTDLEAIFIQVSYTDTLAVTKEHLQNFNITGKALLVHTDWDVHWRTDQYFENHTFLGQDAAEYARDKGVTLIGIDSHNIDDTRGRSRPVHTILLGAEILIVEHLCNLRSLPDSGFTFSVILPNSKG